MMMRILQKLLFMLIIRPLVFVIIGINVSNKEKLPLEGPAIIAANHNSHLDTLTLLSLWPLSKLHQVRPVAAADYFLPNPIMAWFSLNMMRIIPIERKRTEENSDPLAAPSEALAHGEILLIFPEGSRGKPEQMTRFKSGVSRLTERNPDAPIIPVFMHGLGKSLPRGDFVVVPFFSEIVFGDPIYWQNSVPATMEAYQTAMDKLAEQCDIPAWE
jgi:1-acyl-sn-glycerol-3-phosphate acyltransferase